MFRFSPFFLWPLALWLLLQLFCAPAYAQSPYGYPFTITGNTIEYSSAELRFSESFKPIASRSPGGGLVVDSPSRVPLGGGRNLALNVRSVPSGAAVGRAVGTFAKKLIFPLVVLSSVIELCNELGYRCSQGQDGNPVVEKTTPYTGLGGPQGAADLSTCVGSAWPSAGSFCKTSGGAVRGHVTTAVKDALLASGKGWQWNNNNGSYHYVLLTAGPALTPAALQPSTIYEVEFSVGGKTFWAENSAITRVLNDALASGIPLEVPAPSTITGPTTVQGPKTTTTTPAQNGNPAKTVTTSTVTNVTYEGPKVTTNNVTTTVTQTTNNNVPETTTETEESEPELAPVDSVNPDLPKLYERKYPDGLTGVWTTRKAELAATPLRNLIGSLTPTIVSSNGCPQFSIPLNLGRWNWGTYALGPPCMVWDFLKVCVLLCAGFLVRAIVFGG